MKSNFHPVHGNLLGKKVFQPPSPDFCRKHVTYYLPSPLDSELLNLTVFSISKMTRDAETKTVDGRRKNPTKAPASQVSSSWTQSDYIQIAASLYIFFISMFHMLPLYVVSSHDSAVMN